MTRGPLRPLYRSLDLITLRLVLAATEEGNLAKVAARENISLSAVSRRISDLESRLGVKLLHRHDRGVAATDAAAMAAGRIRSIFSLLEQVFDDLQDVRDGVRGVVRVRSHLTAVVSILPERIASFRVAHPGINIVVDEGASVDILHDVQVGDCDIGLVSGTIEGGSLTLIPWGLDRLVVLMPHGHPLEGQERLRFAALLDYPFIGMFRSSALQTLYRGQAAALGRALDERARVSSFEGARAMIAAGLGLGIMPASVLPLAMDGLALTVRPLAEDWATRPLMICVRDPAQATAAARLFIEHLHSTPHHGD